MDVADVGAGTGLFTRLFAPKVLPEGTVFGVDITETFLAHIKATCAEQQIENVETVLCTPTSTKLKPQSVDLVFMCDTYHHFEYPYKMLASIHQSLRDKGILVIIDRKNASDHVRADQETVRKEATAAGFKVLEERKVAKTEYLMRFAKAKAQ